MFTISIIYSRSTNYSQYVNNNNIDMRYYDGVSQLYFYTIGDQQ